MRLKNYGRIVCQIKNKGDKDFWRIEEHPKQRTIDIRLWTHLDENGAKHATKIGASIPFDKFERMMPAFKAIEEKLFVEKIKKQTLDEKAAKEKEENG